MHALSVSRESSMSHFAFTCAGFFVSSTPRSAAHYPVTLIGNLCGLERCSISRMSLISFLPIPFFVDTVSIPIVPNVEVPFPIPISNTVTPSVPTLATVTTSSYKYP